MSGSLTTSRLLQLYRDLLRVRIPAAFALVLLVVLPSEGLGFSLCPFSLLSGIPCPACGLVRSMSSLLDLRFSLSFSYHPLGVLVLGLIVSALITNRTDPIPSRLVDGIQKEKKHVPGILVCLFLLVWLIRLAAGSGDLLIR